MIFARKSSLVFAQYEFLFPLFDSIDVPIYISDPETYKILYCNRALKSLFGNISGKKCHRALHNFSQPCDFCSNAKIFGENEGKTHVGERQNNINKRWYHFINRAICWSDGRMVRFEIAIDITERKEQELATNKLTQEQSLLRLLNDAANQGESLTEIFNLFYQEVRNLTQARILTFFLISDDQKKLILHYYNIPKQDVVNLKKLVNDNLPFEIEIPLSNDNYYYKIVKDKKPVIINSGRRIRNLFAEGTEELLDKHFIETARRILKIESVLFLPLVTHQGKNIALLALTRDLPLAKSEVKKLSTISRELADLIHRKLTECCCQESEEKYRILTENSPNMIIIIQGEKIIYANKCFIDQMRYSPEELYNRDFTIGNLITTDDVNKITTHFKTIKQGGKGKTFQCTLIPKNRPRIVVEFIVKPIEFQGKPAVFSTLTDITKFNALQEEKEMIVEKWYESLKMEAIGRLTSSLARDFNHYLTATLGYTEIALSKTDKNNPIFNIINHIFTSADFLKEINHRLLLSSRKSLLELTLLSMNEMMKGMEDDFRKKLGTGYILKTRYDMYGHNVVRIDKAKIAMVLLILVENAMDALPKGGVITITCENIEVTRKKALSITGGRPGSFVCVSVIDTGKGIKSSLIQQIFEPYFTTKEPEPGTGLGLSIVYSLVKQHEGFIDVESQVGKGTSFHIYLPHEKAEPLELSNISQTEELVQGNHEVILIIENDIVVRNYITLVLTSNNYVIEQASTLAEAYTWLARSKKIDLIFSETNLPDGTGIQLITEIGNKIPIMLGSSYLDDKTTLSFIKEENITFLEKPYPMATLLATIKKVLSSHCVNSEKKVNV